MTFSISGWFRSPLALLLATAIPGAALAQSDASPLWTIGQPDHQDAEFALAPSHYGDFRADAFYIVGQSDPKRDWPYVQPGPGDAWAGSREHAFTVLFGLKSRPSAGECQLKIGLLDTHYSNPPKLRVQVNGKNFERALPKGGGDASIRGDAALAKAYQLAISFPSELLVEGDNDVQITTLTGSWVLYDSVSLATPVGAELGVVKSRTVVAEVQSIRALRAANGQETEPVRVALRHAGDPVEATLQMEGLDPVRTQLHAGDQTIELAVPAVSREETRTLRVSVGGNEFASRTVTVRPVRKRTIYVLPHSHTDIGYTEIQTAIEKKQVNNLLEGIAAARRTADYPPGARFVWNVEVLWAADLYLHRLTESERAEFVDAVKKGWVGLNGMYLNELTGLCRPEELLELFRFSTELSQKCGVPIDSAMISDVPGYTWGTVPAMAQAGIRYFSTAPNYFDRIGDILGQWENKPFWWSSPSGHEKVLVWIPYMGYAMSHLIHHFTPEFVDQYQGVLEKEQYPYDIAYVRWSGHGDNAVPDPAICEFFKDWNTKYAWPKFIVARTSDAFRAFETRYGDQLPVVHGDWTPYWEDGAGSSALETAMNRNTSDRLVQANALFALSKADAYPVDRFAEAWRHTLLYSEHTWGADCSVSDPESQKTHEQWDIKRSYAVDADAQSRQLLTLGLKAAQPTSDAPAETDGAQPIDLFNTTSWSRTELVTLPAALSWSGDRVTDDAGQAVPSQRLSTGELVFVAKDVAPFSSRRFTVHPGPAMNAGRVEVGSNSLDNGRVRLRLDSTTGALAEFSGPNGPDNLVDTAGGEALNDYRFLPGEDLKRVQRNGPVKITVKERGPLVASLLVTSSAPGCYRLAREVRVVAGFDYVELLDTVDKDRAAIPSKPGDGAFAQKSGKESVNFAFPFRVANGEVSLDIPLGWMRPEIDQMPSACKNWFTVGRWADVSNREHGVALVTLDAPLLEVGGLTANMTGSQTNPKVWRKHVEPTQHLYVWAMNNHWHTNYRAYQDGPVTFRFVLRPHGTLDRAELSRFATGFSQPLLASRGTGLRPTGTPLFRVDSPEVQVLCLKPSDDGKAWIVRLFGAGGKDVSTRLAWNTPAPSRVSLSDTSEQPGREITDTVEVPAWGVVTLRAER